MLGPCWGETLPKSWQGLSGRVSSCIKAYQTRSMWNKPFWTWNNRTSFGHSLSSSNSIGTFLTMLVLGPQQPPGRCHSSDGATCSPVAPLLASSQPGVLEKWSSFYVPGSWVLSPGGSGAACLSPVVFTGCLMQAPNAAEGCSAHVGFLDCPELPAKNRLSKHAAGALIGRGWFELPKAGLLLEAEFFLCLMLIQVFPCKIPIALRHTKCRGVVVPAGCQPSYLAIALLNSLQGFYSPSSGKDFWGLCFICTSPIPVNEELPWSCMS